LVKVRVVEVVVDVGVGVDFISRPRLLRGTAVRSPSRLFIGICFVIRIDEDDRETS
jgi:hypothetical protein